jgi:hypothetical protein
LTNVAQASRLRLAAETAALLSEVKGKPFAFFPSGKDTACGISGDKEKTFTPGNL